MNYTFTHYENVFDKHSNPVSASWEEWVPLLTTHTLRGANVDRSDKDALDRDKDGPGLVFGKIPQGKPRTDKNVVSFSAMAVDSDSSSEDTVLKALHTLAEYEFIVYTTHKHGADIPDNYRVRIVIPFSKEINAKAFYTVWDELNELLGNINDKSTRNPSRFNFLPSTFDMDLAVAFHNPTGVFYTPPNVVPKARNAPKPKDSADEILQYDRESFIRNAINRIPKNDRNKEALSNLSHGEPFAEEGSRHKAIVGLTMWLAIKFTDLTSVTLGALFSASLSKMYPDDYDALAEVLTAYEGAVEKVKESRNAFVAEQAGPEGQYSEEELAEISKKCGYPVDDLYNKWIIQKGGATWLLTPAGYAGPYVRDDAHIASATILKRAPVRLMEVTNKGTRRRAFHEVSCEFGTVADHITTDLRAQITTFDARTRTIVEAPLPIRVQPEYNKQIDDWLARLGGPLYPKLIDWISCCSDLSKMLCAVYLEGKKSTGKTLLPYGLARIWTDGPPSDIELVLGSFNETLIECPLVLADEELPQKQGQNVTAKIRSMLSTNSRQLTRKYMPPSTIKGYLRLMLAANNSFLLNGSDVATANDLEAIAQRFLYIEVGDDAAKYLEGIPRETKAMWAAEGIAKHAMWLAENHVVVNKGTRFEVEGDISEMHRELMSGSYWNSKVCEWLAKYILNPEIFNNLGNGLVVVNNGRLMVNSQALVDHWKMYLTTNIEPEIQKIGAALRSLAKDEKWYQLHHNRKRIRYRYIDEAHIYDWVNRYGIGSKDQIGLFLAPEVADISATRKGNTNEPTKTKRAQDSQEANQ